MPDYALHGAVLRSAVPLRNFPPGDGSRPAWTLSLSNDPTGDPGQLIGRQVHPGCVMTLARTAAGYRYTHSCTGVFDVCGGGREVHYAPATDAPADAVQNDIVNRVLAVALHAAGTLTLHGSGVAVADVDGQAGVVGFLAPKGTGKSTLAATLVAAAARLVSDDMLSMKPTPTGADVLPGVHQLRLCDDAAEQVLDGLGVPTPDGAHGDGASAVVARGADAKQIVAMSAGARAQATAAPARALYVLAPAPGDAPEAARRTLLPPVAAAIALLPHAKLAPLLGGPELPALLDRAAALAAVVPVYMLHVARDLSRLDEVAQTILAWHGVPDAAAVVA